MPVPWNRPSTEVVASAITSNTPTTPFCPPPSAPPKPPPPSAPDSPALSINEPKTRGCPVGALSRHQCLPLVEAAITTVVAPMGAPQANQPTTQPKRRPSRPSTKRTTTQPRGGSPGTLAPPAPPAALYVTPYSLTELLWISFDSSVNQSIHYQFFSPPTYDKDVHDTPKARTFQISIKTSQF